MQEEEKHTMEPDKPDSDAPETETGKRKKKKGKSLMETMREIDEKEARLEAEAQERQRALLEEQEKREKEAYDKKIQQDRIELIRLKQGLIETSDTIYEEHEEKPKLSLRKKIANFFYHSKWWLWITLFIVAIFAFLIYDYFSQVKPDLIVMVLTDDDGIQERTEELELYFEQFTDDENGDGKIQVDIYAIPVTDDIGENDYYTGNLTKLSTQMQLGDCVLILTDAKANAFINADETLTCLEDLYPDEENVRDLGYYLRHTDFATKIGYSGKVDRDLSLGLRTPIKTYDSLEDMQENYDIAVKVLERIMDDLDGTIEPEDVTEASTDAATTEEGID